MNIKQYIFRPDVVSFIGMAIVAIGGFIGAFWRVKKYPLIIFIGALIVAIGGLWAGREAKKFEAELKEKNKYILSTVTGGDSFCYLSLGSINSSTNNALMLAVSRGKYPLYEVQLRIVDLEKNKKIMEERKGEKVLPYKVLIERDIIINVGNIPPDTAPLLGEISLGPGTEKKYNVFISARNGFYTQQIRLKRIEGEWVVATRLMKFGEEIELFKKIDPKFPKNEADKVDWN